VNKTALPQYDSLLDAATTLNTAVIALESSQTDANLLAAQTAWKNIRRVWEQCEGFLIGPIESFDYDPNTDTWPTDYSQMNALINGSQSLTSADIAALSQNLRGYHPIEFLLFRNAANNGQRMASTYTVRELQYMTSLAANLLDSNAQPLLNSWLIAPTNFGRSVLTAGTANNTVYPTKQAFFLDIIGDNGMAGICNEVGSTDADGKMYAPFIAKDSSITESPYSDNSLVDFRNNIIGAQNVYLGLNGGKGVKDLVAALNKDLDTRIQAQFTAAINSFNNITERYELAIFDQRTQVQATLTQLQALRDLLDGELTAFIQTNVKD
jgi:predicted lipoprotein